VISAIIRQSIRYPGVVVALAVTLIVYGLYVLTRANLDVFPAYYAHMGPTNAAGPAPVDLSLPAPADPAELRRRIDAGEWVVDLRSREVFARGHVPGTLSFDLDGAFVAYVSWMIPVGTPLTLLGETTEQVEAAQRELVRIGIDRPAAQAVGGPLFWLDDEAGEQPASVRRIDFRALAAVLAADPDAVVLDTRQVLEWEAGHVAEARFLPFYDVETQLAELPRDRTIYVYCGSGYRAAAVTSLLLRAGLTDVVHVDDQFANAAVAGLEIVSEAAPEREPGWTWTASRGSVRQYQPRTAPAV
jgi:rhodanese-related sulfurtransferase